MRYGTRSRRRVLSGVAVSLGLLAGCTTDDDIPDEGGTPDTDGAETDPSERPELDLREANVVDLSFEADGRTYTFDVSLDHNDDGEDGYANWWQVERLDGTRLGRRDLLHAHSQQPFTRSESIDIPDSVSCVVVRGHDQTHGYGGQAAVLALDTGETNFVDQGTSKQSFASADCP
ncbi:hypothetical protein [Halovenus sp. HT40]|uniref:hypothetical protein n=1 Tax=Halovenus sp. HT40 TaxID=3126691 RepID=UPI00300F4BE4